MAIVFVLVLLDVFLLTVWEFLDPLRIVVHNKTTEHMVIDNLFGRTLVRSSVPSMNESTLVDRWYPDNSDVQVV